MLEEFKMLLKEKGLLAKLSDDKIADSVYLTMEITKDKELTELVTKIGLNEAVNYIVEDSDEEIDIEKAIEDLIKIMFGGK